MPEQLTFDLPSLVSVGRQDFFVSDANSIAVNMIENWQDWPNGKCVLAGPSGSGKSHLGHIWTGLVAGQMIGADDVEQLSVQSAICIDDIHTRLGDEGFENGLFHAHNRCAELGFPLLMIGNGHPNDWTIVLPDLRSRIQATNLAEVRQPDDALLQAVLVKIFADKQVTLPPEITTYVGLRIERSFDAIQRFASALDKRALMQKKKINRKLAAEILDEMSDANG